MNDREMTQAEFQELLDSGQLKIRQLTPQEQEDLWRKKVLEQYRHTCANCGSEDHVTARLIVPQEAGGKLSISNASTICRVCQAASKAVAKAQDRGLEEKSPVNVWVSRRLYDLVNGSIESKRGFNSMATLIRYLVGEYVDKNDNFEDLAQWQDEGVEVKINFLVPTPLYEIFKSKVSSNGLTVTQAVQGLLTWYVSEAAPVLVNALKEPDSEGASNV